MLENACYEFAAMSMKDMIAKEGWDCPESVELNHWAQLFRSSEYHFDEIRLGKLGKPFPEFLEAIAQIRHTAVCRIRLNAKTVQQFICDGECLASLLGNSICVEKLSRLRREAQKAVDEVGRNKDLLESKLMERLQEIDAQRSELDRLESQAVEDMLREDRQYQTLIGTFLGQTVGSPDSFQHSGFTSEHESNSGAEIDIESFGSRSLKRSPGSTEVS